MRVNGYKCDECGTEKQLTNHWVIAFVSNGRIHFVPWGQLSPDAQDAIHLCGSGCAAKVLSKTISNWQE